jgi:hypothetical protein
MNKRLLVVVVGMLCLSSSAWATPSSGKFGLGVVFGEPTGLVAKYWTGHRSAFDFGLAYSFGSYVAVYSDYLYHFPGSIHAREAFFNQLVPYVGIGATAFFAGGGTTTDGKKQFDKGATAGIGARIPLGIEWLPPKAPIGVFLELVPGVGLVPGVYGFLEGGLGVRYYF